MINTLCNMTNCIVADLIHFTRVGLCRVFKLSVRAGKTPVSSRRRPLVGAMKTFSLHK